MGDFNKIAPVARFELAEALHSKAIVALAAWCVGGTLLATGGFLVAYKSAADAARDALARELGVPLSSLPEDLVRERAQPWLLGLVEDASTRELLAKMEPLSLFFTVAVTGGVLVAVLLSGNGIRRALAHGAARYQLFRVSRLAWTIGMLAAHGALVGAGLLLSVLAALLVGYWMAGASGALQPLYLLRAAAFSWAYGLAYVGILNGVLLTLSNKASGFSNPVLVLLALWLGHAVVTADAVAARLPGVQNLAWLFPSHYSSAVWAGSAVEFLSAVVGLLVLGLAASAGGYYAFSRRDV